MTSTQTNILRKIDSKGKERVWYANRDGNTYVTNTGLRNGKIIEKKYTITNPKGKNTPEEQAEKDMRSKERKKYERELYSYDLSVPHPLAFTQPMLAMDYTKTGHRVDWLKLWFAQPKLNGVRCTAKKDKTGVILTSRKGKVYKVAHIENELLNQVFSRYPNIEVDGELYLHGTELGDITHMVAHGDPKLEYHIFDIVDPNNIYYDRNTLLEQFDLDTPLFLPSIVNVQSFEGLNAMHDSYVHKGYEGAMLKSAHGLYENKRSMGLWKYKKFQDSEFRISGTEQDKDGGAILILTTDTGVEFKSRPIGTNEFRLNLWDKRSTLIGKQVTVRYSNLLESGVPEFNRTLQGGVLRDYE